jgi:uncharacterized membrane protein
MNLLCIGIEAIISDIMEECKTTDNSGFVAASPAKPEDKKGFRWLVNWTVLLSTVFLFAAALNCLFAWLAYGFRHDAAGFVFSLVLALLVYFGVFNSGRTASLQGRLLLSACCPDALGNTVFRLFYDLPVLPDFLLLLDCES